jgi:branched-chain amino acid transport system permease protein
MKVLAFRLKPFLVAVEERVEPIFRLFFLLLLLMLPLIIEDVYWLHMLNVIGIFSLLAIGLNLVVGFTSTFSLGHAAFYGIGAYTTALLSTGIGFPFWANLLASAFVAGVFGLLLGVIFRLRGPFLAVATLAFGEIVRLVLLNWVSFTGGPNGIANIPWPVIGSIELSNDHRYYYLVLATVIFQFKLISRLGNSRVGRAMRALKDSEDGARACGVWVLRYQMLSFVIAACFAGIAGGLYAHLITYVSPDPFNLMASIEMLFMIVLGGLGSIPGSVVGAAVVAILPEYFRIFQEYRLIIYSVSILIILKFAPGGLWGLIGTIPRQLSKLHVGVVKEEVNS